MTIPTISTMMTIQMMMIIMNDDGNGVTIGAKILLPLNNKYNHYHHGDSPLL